MRVGVLKGFFSTDPRTQVKGEEADIDPRLAQEMEALGRCRILGERPTTGLMSIDSAAALVAPVPTEPAVAEPVAAEPAVAESEPTGGKPSAGG